MKQCHFALILSFSVGWNYMEHQVHFFPPNEVGYSMGWDFRTRSKHPFDRAISDQTISLEEKVSMCLGSCISSCMIACHLPCLPILNKFLQTMCKHITENNVQNGWSKHHKPATLLVLLMDYFGQVFLLQIIWSRNQESWTPSPCTEKEKGP